MVSNDLVHCSFLKLEWELRIIGEYHEMCSDNKVILIIYKRL